MTKFVQSDLLSRVPGVSHGFGSLAEPIPAPFLSDWERARPRWKQVHGAACADVRASGQDYGEVDALYSRAAGIPIAVQTADCVPILLARRDGSEVAAVHAGWRGTRARILRALFARLKNPAEWVGAVGPAIGPCCYEVDEALARDFEKEFAAAGAGVAVPRFRHLDLPAINAWELRNLGIGEVDLIRACTRCSVGPLGASPEAPGDYRFHSFRRERGGTRQFSVIRIERK